METNNYNQEQEVSKKKRRSKKEDLDKTQEIEVEKIQEQVNTSEPVNNEVVYNTPVMNNNYNMTNNVQPVNEETKKANKKYVSMGQLFAVLLITIIVTLLLGAGGILLAFHLNPDLLSTKNTTTNITKTEKEVTITDEGIADAVEKIWDSVVVVETYKNNKLYATGSGFVYKKDDNKYYLLTNYHVINGGTSIKVVFSNKKRVDVEVVGGDKYVDIAVLSYKTTTDLKVAEVGSSVKSRVGDTVFAIGAPLDSSIYSWTVTRGVISGKDREVEVSTSDNSYSSDWIMQVLQTDAAINSGNSGGPLCNSNGQVIGITNMKLVTTGVEGMGFAIPIEEASSYADSVISGKDLSRPYLGISMQDVSGGYYTSDETGVKVVDVEAGSPADKAGLKAGDIIIGMDDTKITNVASLRYKLYSYKVGDKVKITYKRDGREHNTNLTLGANKNDK